MATVSTDRSESIRRVIEIPGFGPIGVGRFVAALGDGQAFKCGRVVSAWLRLTPHQYSTSGNRFSSAISKRGNRYLCTILVHGARAVLKTAETMDKKILSAVGCARLQNTTVNVRRSSRLQTRWHRSVGRCWPKTYTTIRSCCDGLTTLMCGALVNEADRC